MDRRKSPLLRSLTALTTVVTALCAATATGCGDTCEEANLRLEECLGASGEGELFQGSEPECSGAQECRSECSVEASCRDIGNYFCKLSRPADPSTCTVDEDGDGEPDVNPYEACILSCAE